MTFRNFIEEFCTGTGNTITLTGVTSGSAEFSSIYTNAQTFSYVIEDSGGNIIVGGSGTYNSAGDTITRNDSWEIVSGVYDAAPASNRTLSGGTHVIRVAPISDDMNNWDTAYARVNTSKIGTAPGKTRYTGDLDTLVTVGFENIDVSATTNEPPATDGNMINQTWDSSTWGTQIYTTWGGDMWLRGKNNNVWSTWQEVLHTGNFTPGDYLPLAGGTLTGQVLINNNQGLIFKNAAGSNDATQIYRAGGDALRIHYTANALVFQGLADEAVNFRGAADTTTVTIQSGTGNVIATGNVTGANLNISSWDTAFGWGDHSTEGYLVSADLSNYAVLNAGNTFTANQIISRVGGAVDTKFLLGADAGFAAEITFRHGSTATTGQRWTFGTDEAAEAGSNAGSNLEIQRFSDTGATLGTALSINRATGDITIENNLNGIDPSTWITNTDTAFSTTNVNLTATGTSANYRLVFTSADDAGGDKPLFQDSSAGLYYNPSTNILTVGSGVVTNNLQTTNTQSARTTDTIFYSSSSNIIYKNTAAGFRTSLDVYSKGEVDSAISGSGAFLPLAGDGSQAVAVQELHLTNQEPANITADGQLGYDASIGLMLYKTQNYGDAGDVDGVYMVLDTGNIATGPSLSLTGNGVTAGGTTPLTISVDSAYQTNWDNAYDRSLTSVGFNTGNGILTLTKQDATTLTQDLDGRYLLDTTDTFTGTLTVDGDVTIDSPHYLVTAAIRANGGQQLVLNGGESHSYATGQTAELIYLNAEGGIQINSSPDNWLTTGWAGRYTATICNSSGDSILPGNLTAAKNGATTITLGENSTGDSTDILIGKGFDVASSIQFRRGGLTDASIRCNASENLIINYSENLTTNVLSIQNQSVEVARWDTNGDLDLNSNDLIDVANVDASGDVSAASFSDDGGNTIHSSADAWLRLNPTNDFTSGIYCNSAGVLRHDGGLEVGASGSAFDVTAAGAVTAAGNIISGGYLMGQSAGGGSGLYLDSTGTWAAGTLYCPGLRWREDDGTSVAGIRGYVTASGNALALGTGWLDEEMTIFPTYVDFANDVRVSNILQVGNEIVHEGDTDNSITFGTDTQTYQTGGVTRMTLNSTGINFGGNLVFGASYYRTDGTGVQLRLEESGWTTSSHDIIYNGYGTLLGDYAYLKASGNSTTGHGRLIVADNGLWYGTTSAETGAAVNSVTIPNEVTNRFRVDSSGYMYAARWYVGSAGSSHNQWIANPFTDVMSFYTNSVQRGNFDNAGFDVQGAITATGNITAYSSDERLKDAKPLHNAMNMVNQWQAVRYTWNEKAKLLNEVFDHDNVELGLIAQSVQKTAPELIAPAPFDRDLHDESISRENYITVDYDRASAVLVAALQEKDAEIKDLTTRLEILENLLLGDN